MPKSSATFLGTDLLDLSWLAALSDKGKNVLVFIATLPYSSKLDEAIKAARAQQTFLFVWVVTMAYFSL